MTAKTVFESNGRSQRSIVAAYPGTVGIAITWKIDHDELIVDIKIINRLSFSRFCRDFSKFFPMEKMVDEEDFPTFDRPPKQSSGKIFFYALSKNGGISRVSREEIELVENEHFFIRNLNQTAICLALMLQTRCGSFRGSLLSIFSAHSKQQMPSPCKYSEKPAPSNCSAGSKTIEIEMVNWDISLINMADKLNVGLVISSGLHPVKLTNQPFEESRLSSPRSPKNAKYFMALKRRCK